MITDEKWLELINALRELDEKYGYEAVDNAIWSVRVTRLHSDGLALRDQLRGIKSALGEKVNDPIESLCLPTRIRNAIRRQTEVKTIDDLLYLMGMGSGGYQYVKNFGEKSRQIVLNKLKDHSCQATEPA